LSTVKDIALGLLIALMVVLIVLASTGEAERFIYGAF
jgi:hypothetical protein